MEQAHLVGVYTQEEMPEELEGFVRYQAACDGHQMKAGESVGIPGGMNVLEHLFQDRDHPQVLNIPMSLYLKGFLVRPL